MLANMLLNFHYKPFNMEVNMPYIPHTEAELQEMLDVVGVRTLDDLFNEIPAELKAKPLNMPETKSEYEVCKYLAGLAGMNRTDLVSFIGGGFYDHIIPEVVNALSSRGEFVTAYTPYQPEVSQGTLQAIFEYQTAVARLTGLDCANASVYDGGFALFEAVTMSMRHTGKKRIVIDAAVSPIWLTMLRTHLDNLEIELVEVAQVNGMTQIEALKNAIDENTASVIVQNPNFFGNIYDFSELFATAHAKNALAVIAIQPMMQALLKTPAEMDADIAVADGQSLGLPLAFGGPYLGIMTCKKALVRQMPGRIVGRTQDVDGKVGYVLTIQAREQHIRRAKATSNICSNQALCALRSLIYMSVTGSEGMERTALLSMENTRYAANLLLSANVGIERLSNEDVPYAYEIALKLPCNAHELVEKLVAKGYVAGFPIGRYYDGMDNVLLLCCTEKHTKEEIGILVEMIKGALSN